MSTQEDHKQVSVCIPLRQKAELEAEAAERGVSSSEYIREILQSRHEAKQLRDRLDAREERITELERQMSQHSEIEQKVDMLAKQQDTANGWYRCIYGESRN